MKFINCGCGEKYTVQKEWLNIDFNSTSKDVMAVNLLKKMPIQDSSIDAIYNSCMLEHFSKDDGKRFIRDCYRILKSNGIIRIVVPDLENICREYIRILNECRDGKDSKSKYDYITIELIDQMTRTSSGGEMVKYWNGKERDDDYIKLRTGYPEGYEIGMDQSFSAKLKYKVYLIKKKILNSFTIYRKIQLANFVLSGEQHKWMYDAYSLKELLEEVGFVNVRKMHCNESDICNWNEYGLEVTDKGREYKPNCLYMEAMKK